MVDVLVDLQYGDCGKGKVSKWLNRNATYDSIAKYNGGGNAGHSVYIGDKEYIAHYLTSAIYPTTKEVLTEFGNKTSYGSNSSNIVIGPGCVINPVEFLKEVFEFDELFNIKTRVFIHPYAHIITNEHIYRDDPDGKIGSTKKGIGPAYEDKYGRKNVRAQNMSLLKDYLMTTPDKLRSTDDKPWYYGNVLMEGSQGWGLDIDWGNYPYVTSSHIHPAFAFATFGIPLHLHRKTYGVCKPYLTYVGSSDNIVHCDHDDAEKIRKAGNEFGKTTGRPRKIGYLDMRQLVDAANRTGVSELFINKCDVLVEAGVFKFYDMQGKLCTVNSIEDLQIYIEQKIFRMTDVEIIYYGFSADSNEHYRAVNRV